MLLDHFASRRRFLVRDNQLSSGIVVDVVVLGLGLCNHRETNEKGETKCETQSCTSPRLGDRFVYSSIVSFSV
jgi:hypothetical protein